MQVLQITRALSETAMEEDSETMTNMELNNFQENSEKEIKCIGMKNFSGQNGERTLYPKKAPTISYRKAIRQQCFRKLEPILSVPINIDLRHRAPRIDHSIPIRTNSHPQDLGLKFAMFSVPTDSSEASDETDLLYINEAGDKTKDNVKLFECFRESEQECSNVMNAKPAVSTVTHRCNRDRIILVEEFKRSRNLISKLSQTWSDYMSFKSHCSIQFELLWEKILFLHNKIYESESDSLEIMHKKAKTLRVRIGHVFNKYMQIAKTKVNPFGNGRFLFQYYIDKVGDEISTFAQLFECN